MKKTKKRNPADTTMRNIRALKSRVSWLETMMNMFIEKLENVTSSRKKK